MARSNTVDTEGSTAEGAGERVGQVKWQLKWKLRWKLRRKPIGFPGGHGSEAAL